MDLIRAPPPNLQGPTLVMWVDSGFVDDEYTHQFNTIQKAIDFVHDSPLYNTLDERYKALINVYPGWYSEQIKCWNYIVINAYCNTNLRKYSSTTISNTGVDRDHYPLAAGPNYVYEMNGFDIRCNSGQTHTEAGWLKMKNCLFYNGSIKENTTDDLYGSMSFKNCTFWDGDGFNLSGSRVGTGIRFVYLENTRVNGDVKLKSTGSGTALIEIINSVIAGGNVDIAGNWDFDIQKSHIYDNIDGTRNIFDTSTGYINFYNSSISNGIHFIQDTTGNKIIHSCDFNDSLGLPITGADITADVPITIVDYVQNIQQNGNCGNLQILDPVKPVGANAINRYQGIQCAIDSVSTKGVIDLNESYTGLAELSIPTGVNITIDGHKLYSLSFTNNIVTLNTNEQLIFYGLTDIIGNKIEINGNSSYIGFEETLTAHCYIVLTAGTGTYCLVYTSTIKAPSGFPAIKQDNVNSVIVSGYSRIDGGIGHPAIRWTVDADNKFKCKYSTLLHGDGGGNSPLDYTGAGKVDIAMYSSALNAAWNPADFYNTVGSANNTTDANIDF